MLCLTAARECRGTYFLSSRRSAQSFPFTLISNQFHFFLHAFIEKVTSKTNGKKTKSQTPPHKTEPLGLTRIIQHLHLRLCRLLDVVDTHRVILCSRSIINMSYFMSWPYILIEVSLVLKVHRHFHELDYLIILDSNLESCLA